MFLNFHNWFTPATKWTRPGRPKFWMSLYIVFWNRKILIILPLQTMFLFLFFAFSSATHCMGGQAGQTEIAIQGCEAGIIISWSAERLPVSENELPFIEFWRYLQIKNICCILPKLTIAIAKLCPTLRDSMSVTACWIGRSVRQSFLRIQHNFYSEGKLSTFARRMCTGNKLEETGRSCFIPSHVDADMPILHSKPSSYARGTCLWRGAFGEFALEEHNIVWD